MEANKSVKTGQISAQNRKRQAKSPRTITDPKILQKLKDIPAAYRGTYERAMTGRSAKAAIRSFCLECVGWQREEIRLCTSPACPLYPYRPYQGKGVEDA